MFIYATDIHLTDKQPINRLTPVLPNGITKFQNILSAAKRENAPVILGGDLFESPHPSYALYNMVINALEKYNVNVYAIFGNHDIMYGDFMAEDNALRALCNSGYIKELTSDPTMISGYTVYGISYRKELYNNLSMLNLCGDTRSTIVVTHQFITPKPLPYGHVLVSDFKAEIGLVLCGHLHTPFDCENKSGTRFINSGCICRLNRNEAAIEPTALRVVTPVRIEPLSLNAEPVEFSQVENKKTDFVKSIDEAKIEVQDIELYIEEQTAEPEVKTLAKELIKKYNGGNK